MHPMTVHGNNPVAGFKILGSDCVLIKGVNHRSGNGISRGSQPQHDQIAQQQVHSRSGRHDDQPLPGLFIAERPAVGVLAFLLTLHAHKSAHRQRPQRIGGLPFLGGPHRGAHTDGEFIDLDSELLCRNEMSEFMDQNERSKYKNCDDRCEKGIQTGNHSFVEIYCRAHARAA